MVYINFSWAHLYNFKLMREIMVNTIICNDGIVYGSYVREFRRKLIQLNELDHIDRHILYDKFYDKNVLPNTWYWRNMKLDSDIDCIIPRESYNTFIKTMCSCYIIYFSENIINYFHPIFNYFVNRYRIKILYNYDEKTFTYIDIIVIDKTHISQYIHDFSNHCDFNINSLLLVRCNLLSKYVFTSMYFGHDIFEIDNCIKNNIAEFSHKTIKNMLERISKIFKYQYEKIKITSLRPNLFNIYLCQNNDNTRGNIHCLTCNKSIYSIYYITVVNKYFHIKCYESKCIHIYNTITNYKNFNDVSLSKLILTFNRILSDNNIDIDIMLLTDKNIVYTFDDINYITAKNRYIKLIYILNDLSKYGY